jgi:hypothetical protein
LVLQHSGQVHHSVRARVTTFFFQHKTAKSSQASLGG